MLEGSAPALGCPSDVVSCLCGKPDFKFGISDCATQACGAEVAPTVTNYLAALCASKLYMGSEAASAPQLYQLTLVSGNISHVRHSSRDNIEPAPGSGDDHHASVSTSNDFDAGSLV
jgi:hypothetical protein